MEVRMNKWPNNIEKWIENNLKFQKIKKPADHMKIFPVAQIRKKSQTGENISIDRAFELLLIQIKKSPLFNESIKKR